MSFRCAPSDSGKIMQQLIYGLNKHFHPYYEY